MSLLWKILFRKEQELTLRGVYQCQFQELHVGCQTEEVLDLIFWLTIKTWRWMMNLKTRTPRFMQWSYQARAGFIFSLSEAKSYWKFLLGLQLLSNLYFTLFCHRQLFLAIGCKIQIQISGASKAEGKWDTDSAFEENLQSERNWNKFLNCPLIQKHCDGEESSWENVFEVMWDKRRNTVPCFPCFFLLGLWNNLTVRSQFLWIKVNSASALSSL